MPIGRPAASLKFQTICKHSMDEDLFELVPFPSLAARAEFDQAKEGRDWNETSYNFGACYKSARAPHQSKKNFFAPNAIKRNSNWLRRRAKEITH